MKKSMLLMVLSVFLNTQPYGAAEVQPLDTHVSYEQGKITHYSSSSWFHIGAWSSVLGAVCGGLTHISLPKVDGSFTQESRNIWIGAAALTGLGIGYLWSSSHVNEELFNHALWIFKNPKDRAVLDLIMSSNNANEIMKAADRTYFSAQYPRLVFVKEVEALKQKLENAHYGLKRAIHDEQAASSPNRYLVKQGSAMLKVLKACTDTLIERYVDLRNDNVYLQQLNCHKSDVAASEARQASTNAMFAAMR